MGQETASNVVEITKRCTKCGVEKALSEFSFSSKKKVNGIRPPRSACKECCLVYKQQWRAKNQITMPVSGEERKCSTCQIVKPSSEYHSWTGSKNRTVARCKECVRAADRKRYTGRRARMTEWQRWHQRKKKFGLTKEAFNALLSCQDGKCAICKRPLGDEFGCHVDHCHATGKTRGLLCFWCNPGLGQFEDNPERLEAAAAYLRRYRDAT